MRVVFDTNVLVSAIIKPGGTAWLIVSIARHGVVRSLVSKDILNEFRRVLTNKFELEPDRIESFIEILSSHSEIIAPRVTLHAVKNDPSDNRILECAVEGNADAIVSGDRHLLTLQSFRGIRILTVREFVDIIHR